MATNRQPRPPSPPAGGPAAGELKRIPLPALPHFRGALAKPASIPAAAVATAAPHLAPPITPAVAALVAPRDAADPAGTVSHLEMSELLSPAHEGGITRPS